MLFTCISCIPCFKYYTGENLSYASEYNPQKKYMPLIYSSSFDSPDNDDNLRKKLGVSGIYILQYGENKIRNNRILIIKKKLNEPSNSFNIVKQIFEFIVQNSKHGRLKDNSTNYIFYSLFYSDQPLEISCGIISSFFYNFLVAAMQFSPHNIRSIIMYTDACLQESAPQEGYLTGGHTALEIRFPEFNKWVVFDLYMGIIPKTNSIPLSMLEISKLKKSEIDFYPVGLDEYGKGLKSKDGVDNYYYEAKDIFGFYGKKSHILFLKPKIFVDQFKKNFFSAYHSETVIYTDPLSFHQKFYSNSKSDK